MTTMRYRPAFAVLCICLGLGARAQQPAVVAITGGTIIDGNGGAPVSDGVVVVSGNRITAAGPRSSVSVPAGATAIDARGKFIVPGLIDTNVHLSLYGGIGERYETIAKYHPRQREIVLEAAQLQLKHGVTTVRDSYGLLVPLVAVRDQIASGAAIGPRILAAGNIVGWGGPVFDQLQPDSRAGADAVPGTGQRRGVAGRRRRSRRHGTGGAAQGDSRLSR